MLSETIIQVSVRSKDYQLGPIRQNLNYFRGLLSQNLQFLLKIGWFTKKKHLFYTLSQNLLSQFYGLKGNTDTGYMFNICIECQVIIQNKNRYELSLPSTLDEVLIKAQFPLLNYRSIPVEFSNISTLKKSWIVGCSKTSLLRWSVFHEVNNQSWALLAFHISLGGFNQCI